MCGDVWIFAENRITVSSSVSRLLRVSGWVSCRFSGFLRPPKNMPVHGCVGVNERVPSRVCSWLMPGVLGIGSGSAVTLTMSLI